MKTHSFKIMREVQVEEDVMIEIAKEVLQYAISEGMVQLDLDKFDPKPSANRAVDVISENYARIRTMD